MSIRIEDLTKDQLSELDNRILEHIDLDEDTECWNWNGSKAYTTNGKPYGIIYLHVPKGENYRGRKPQSFSVRRVVYHIYNPSSILGDLVIESTCGNSLCVNPDHLQHILRRRSPGRKVK